jgi:hypothetical protein
LIAATIALCACSADTDRAAPYLAPPNQPGPCGTTATLFPKLLDFLNAGHFARLKAVIDRRLVPAAGSPAPELSIRTLLDAIVRLLQTIGLTQTANTASLLAKERALHDAKPLFLTALRFTAGQIDGQDRYDATTATGTLLLSCDSDALLGVTQSVLKLESPSAQKLWLAALSDALVPLLDDPTLKPFLDDFMQNTTKGRPAVIEFMGQIVGLLTNPDFSISQVETALESAVYPSVSDALKAKIETLVTVLGEATAPEAGIRAPLLSVARCMQAHSDQRDLLLGFLYDLVTNPAVGLNNVLASARMLVTDEEAANVQNDLADFVGVLRADSASSGSILALLATFISKPDVADALPVTIDLIQAGVLGELLHAVLTLLQNGCRT